MIWADLLRFLFVCSMYKGCYDRQLVTTTSLTPPEDRLRRQLSSKSLLRSQREDMVSIKATAMLIMLLTFCLLATDTSAAYYGCCRSYMKRKLPFPAIKGYSVQTVTELCPISAIIFHTKKGQVCTNPALDWVMEYINLLR
ncbi:hypothetical protein L3Q82_021531 [Scortum barcoo]|uniref:Uncharacterized protein n=1 Tax=Scortum barcoo TaxID=214431 RepID=A0ACB8X4P4_9TELE|nr:hypothetical protein L3Q82_021531 [Scortum barcoo]